ncbi:DnaD domain-containing protein [Peribacillus sp. NPDC096379]|uniref:DnaD domain-containing protein n=1 Tax=Peribacillus sp. NPDC096379 TaxID=3364393 RepID=UPI0037FAA019
MAKYRQVHIEFWQDGFVLDLTPEEKYFYLYLMTNSKTSQCGVYELPKRIVETETGYNRETVDKLLQRFIDYGKIIYDDRSKAIMIVNWAKYNFIKSPKVIACIKKELEGIKNRHLVSEFINNCIALGYQIDGLTITSWEPSEIAQSEIGVEEEDQKYVEPFVIDEPVDVSPVPQEDPFRFYEENGFGVIGSYISEKISSWCADLSDELVVLAMKRSTEQGKKTWRYVEAILTDWFDKGLKKTSEVEAYQLEFKEKQAQKQNKVTPYRRGSARIEAVPKWMQNQPAEESNEPVDIKDLEDRKRKMDQMFQKINP